jgi:ornithine carbamoyltransferase
MSNNLSGRNFLKEVDFTALEWLELLTLSESLKADKAAGREQQHLMGKNIALIFEKTSTRTRCAFEVAAFDQGAHVTYLDSSGSQIGHKESMKDTARVTALSTAGRARIWWRPSASLPASRCSTA